MASGKLEPEVKTEDEEDDVLSLAECFERLNNVRPKPYKTGENFVIFCERFKQYVYLSKLTEKNLYMHFLLLVDDRTYQRLVDVNLDTQEKGDAELFCEKYIAQFHPDSEKLSLQTEVLSCRQTSAETIIDFSYRLKEKAKIAFTDKNVQEINCRLAFLNGVRNPEIRRKLYEANLKSFEEAVEMAERLNRVDALMKQNYRHEDKVVFRQYADDEDLWLYPEVQNDDLSSEEDDYGSDKRSSEYYDDLDRESYWSSDNQENSSSEYGDEDLYSWSDNDSDREESYNNLSDDDEESCSVNDRIMWSDDVSSSGETYYELDSSDPEICDQILRVIHQTCTFMKNRRNS